MHQIQMLAHTIHRFPSTSLNLFNSGAPEVAAIINHDNSVSDQLRTQRLQISTTDHHVQLIPAISCLWEPLAYPILFPPLNLGLGRPG
jgi:hypothetical protein